MLRPVPQPASMMRGVALLLANSAAVWNAASVCFAIGRFWKVRRVLRDVPLYQLLDGRLVDVAFRDGVDAGRVVNDCRVVRSRMKCRCPQCACFCS